MKFLHIMRTVNPQSGGPIEALIQSEPVWRRLGHSRDIVSLDQPNDACVADCPIPTFGLGSPTVKRLERRLPLLRYGFSPRLVPWLRAHVADYDAIVVNGLWNYSDFAARRVLPFQPKPYFVFPHGMLDPWFRRAYPRKHQAKQLSWWLAEGPLLHGARSVLFTSEGERRCAEEAFWPYRFPFNVSGYGTADPPPPSAEQETAWLACVPELRGRAFVLFLGRIHVKKGCDMLLRAFAKVAAQQLDTDLVIAGPDGDGSAASLRALAEQLGIERRVHWPGMLQEGAKWGALHGCLAFALPSHGENFGVAVAEAMACAKPVLVSERVNIAPEIAGEAAGLVRPDTVAGTTALLKTLFELTPAEREAMGQRARRCFLRSFFIDQLAEEVLSILSGQTLPERASHLATAATGAGFVPRAFSQQEA